MLGFLELDALRSIFISAQFTVLPTRHSYSILPDVQHAKLYCAVHHSIVQCNIMQKRNSVATLPPQYKAGGGLF